MLNSRSKVNPLFKSPRSAILFCMKKTKFDEIAW